MRTEIKKGDRFSVYKVIDGSDFEGRFTPGTFRVGYQGAMRILVNVLCDNGYFYFLTNDTEVVKVGEVVINSVK